MAVSCALYDEIELACLRRSRVKIRFFSGKEIEGKAMDTLINDQRQECLQVESGGRQVIIILEQITQFETMGS